MFDIGDIIDGKYRVDGLCSDTGGMGVILFVTPLKTKRPFDVVLKYCKDNSEEQLKRFRREVRPMVISLGGLGHSKLHCKFRKSASYR